MKQKELSLWLKGIVVLVLVCCAVLAGLIVPSMGKEVVLHNPEADYMYWPVLIFFWVSAIPVVAAMILAWNIFHQIGKDNSFCMENANRLKYISRLAMLDTALYLALAAVLAYLKMLSPGVMLLILAVILVGIGMAVLCAALSHLTAKAAALKDENDLTI